MTASENRTDLSQLNSVYLLHPEDSPAADRNAVLESDAAEIVMPNEQANRTELSAEELRIAETFSAKIELEREAAPPRYAQGAQKHMADHTLSVLNRFCTKQLGVFETRLPVLIEELRIFSAESESGKLKGMFKSNFRERKKMKKRYETAHANLTAFAKELSVYQTVLLKDIAVAEAQYERGLWHYKELMLYVAAGTMRLKTPPVEPKVPRRTAIDHDGIRSIFTEKLAEVESIATDSLRIGPLIRATENRDRDTVKSIHAFLTETVPAWEAALQSVLNIEGYAKERLNQMSGKERRAFKKEVADVRTLLSANRALSDVLVEMLEAQQTRRAEKTDAQEELGRMEEGMRATLTHLPDYGKDPLEDDGRK